MDLGLGGLPVLCTENSSTITVDGSQSELRDAIQEVLPDVDFKYDDRSQTYKAVLTKDLTELVSAAEELFENRFRAQLEPIFGPGYSLVAACNALKDDRPEVSVHDVAETFGLDPHAASLSATRDGNTGIFIKDGSGSLLSFKDSFQSVPEPLMAEITAEAERMGLLLTPSSKAVSLAGASAVRVKTLTAGVQEVLPGKALAIEIQHALATRVGVEHLCFAGDAQNDVSGAKQLANHD